MEHCSGVLFIRRRCAFRINMILLKNELCRSTYKLDLHVYTHTVLAVYITSYLALYASQ